MNQPDRSKERFLKKYQAMAHKDGTTWYRSLYPSTWMSTEEDWPSDDVYDTEFKTQRVDIVTIQMPEDCFRALVELEEMLLVPPDRYRGLGIDGQPISHLLARVSYEIRVRTQIPAIKKAWDNYQLLLKLHGSQVEQQDYHFRP